MDASFLTSSIRHPASTPQHPTPITQTPSPITHAARLVLGDVAAFSRVLFPGRALRPYQVEPARAIAESVERGLGRSFAVVFSRQAGKDEMLAQLVAWLLTRWQQRGGSIVLAAPTFQPQAALMRDRLLARLAEPLPAAFTGGASLHDSYAVTLGQASARFLSAAPGANARGQTADLLLVANEAQDIAPDCWDAVFDPMAASTNATTLFLGTVWSRETLLARQMAFLREEERRDGSKRVWTVPWEEVARTLPAYGERVRSRIAQFGPAHPFIRTEYCLQELDGEGGLFPPGRIAAMQGAHPRQHAATPGRRYALLLDVAGEEEGATGPEGFRDDTRRDSTALTIVEVGIEVGKPASWQVGKMTEGERLDQEGNGSSGRCAGSPSGRLVSGRRADSPSCRLPMYRTVDRLAWTGVRHTALHARLVHLAREVWRASVVVVDATGVGAGLASFLAATLGDRRAGRPIPVVPFIFTAASKSALGWDWIGLIDAGRYREYADDGEQLTRLFRAQLAATTYATPPGPGKTLRWGVPPGRGHDDLVMSAALTATLDGVDWRERIATGVMGDG